MKNILLCILATLSFSSVGQDKTMIKCHVSVLGNADTIHYINTIDKTPSQISDELYGRDILTRLSPRELRVYKVHECLEADKAFSEGKARLIEQNLER